MHEGFVAAIKRMDRHQANREARRLDGFAPSNLAAKVTGQALASLTRLRQACCHPQIIRTGNEYLGKARLTMTQIMGERDKSECCFTEAGFDKKLGTGGD